MAVYENIDMSSIADGRCPSIDGKPDTALASSDEQKLLSSYCRKVDIRILAYIILLCVLNMCDRGSLGVAKVVGLEKDLGMVSNEFNIAATLFTVGYVALVLFVSVGVKQLGASRLLPTLGLLWGAVCALHGLAKNKTQFYIMRVLLGMTESGFTSGAILTLSFFYPKKKLTARVGLFYLSSPLGHAISGPLASGLSHINHPTIKRWQWVFIVEGSVTVAVSLLGYFVLQDHPEKCTFLSCTEKKFIVDYKRNEGTLGGSQTLSLKDLKAAILDYQLLIMCLGDFFLNASVGVTTLFGPEIINELGFSSSKSQAMSAIPMICGCAALLLCGHFVRLCRSHCLALIVSFGVNILGSILMVATLNIPARIVGLCLVGFGGFAGVGLFPGWIVSAHSRTSSMSAVASGLSVFCAASASFLSSNIFLNKDAPRFLPGHLIDIAIASLGIVCCVLARVSMGRRNKKALKQGEDGDRFLYVY